MHTTHTNTLYGQNANFCSAKPGVRQSNWQALKGWTEGSRLQYAGLTDRSIMKVTLLQSVWSTVWAGARNVKEPNRAQCLPACHLPSRCVCVCVLRACVRRLIHPHNKPSCPYIITAGLRNAAERVSYEDWPQTSVFEVVPWITSFLAGLSRRKPEFDPVRRSAQTGFAPSQSPLQYPILTFILLP